MQNIKRLLTGVFLTKDLNYADTALYKLSKFPDLPINLILKLWHFLVIFVFHQNFLFRATWNRLLKQGGSIRRIHVTAELLQLQFSSGRQHLNSRTVKGNMFKIILLVAFVAFVQADDVLELGDADFDSQLEAIDTALVMFYAPW